MNLFNKRMIQIAQQIHQNGGELYLVGGAVRDYLRNQQPHDMDFCVTGLSSEAFLFLFPNAKLQGKAFPVFVMGGNEFALARTEKKIGQKHTDFEIHIEKSISIEEDLKRRDITINSMAIKVLSEELVDPFGGKKDLENHVIRKTSNAFFEDPLRAYRAARFASSFGFDVTDDTLLTMSQMKNELIQLSKERVFTEFRKALVSDHPSTFFIVLQKAKLLDVHFTELYNLIGVEQPLPYHPEGDAYTHSLEVLEKVAVLTPNAQIDLDEELTRFCALVHDFGKAATPHNEWPKHIGHEQRGIELVHDFCTRINAPNKFEKAGKLTSLLHMKAGNYTALKPSTKVRMFEQISSSRSISFEGIEMIAKADSKNKNLSFARIAHEVMKINATEEMKQKCTLENGMINFEKLKEMLLNKRCQFIKQEEKEEKS